MNKSTYLGKHRHTIKQMLIAQRIDFVEFARWLYLPKTGVLLNFCGQHCVHLAKLPKK